MKERKPIIYNSDHFLKELVVRLFWWLSLLKRRIRECVIFLTANCERLQKRVQGLIAVGCCPRAWHDHVSNGKWILAHSFRGSVHGQLDASSDIMVGNMISCMNYKKMLTDRLSFWYIFLIRIQQISSLQKKKNNRGKLNKPTFVECFNW